jgi:threonine/homoserine/homoserine lactone efflux protein
MGAQMIDAEFLLTSLVVVLVPGTGVIYTVSTGLALRWRASIAAAIGCTAGIVPHLTASIFGLSVILHNSADIFQILKITGTLYLLFLAWSMWQDTGAIQLDGQASNKNAFQIILRGILINLLNPKLALFFFAFLPQFISADVSSPTQQMIGLGALFMLMTLIIFILYGILASGVSAYLLNSPRAMRYVQRTFALVFAVLALKLALSDA